MKSGELPKPGEKTPSDEAKQHFGSSVLDSIEYAEQLQGYVDPEVPVYDQN